MGLGVRDASEGTVEVSATENVVSSFLFVYFVECVQQFQAGYADIGESSVDLSPFIAKEGAVWLLQSADILNSFLLVDETVYLWSYLILSKIRRVKMA